MKQKTVVIDRFSGSKGWLIFWILVFFPIAIWYYLDKKQPTEVLVK